MHIILAHSKRVLSKYQYETCILLFNTDGDSNAFLIVAENDEVANKVISELETKP